MRFRKPFYQASILLGLMLTSFIAISCPICQEEKIKIGRLPVEQHCIDVGGNQLYMQITGTQDPTIIFESGLGDTSSGWNKVIAQVAKFSRTVTYDRNGLGRSQNNGTETRTAQDAVNNLKTMLEKSQLLPPYILVGHSLGGLYMQLFAQEYPDEVLGVVLVDSATSDQSGDQPLPPDDAPHYLEAKGLKGSIQQVKVGSHFPAIPLIILTSGQRGEKWIELQKHLVALSPKSKQIVTYESGHHIQNEQPDLVINTIHEMVKDIKKIQRSQAAALIHEFIAARNQHDIKAALEPFADDVTWKTSWGETLKGKEALRKMLAQQFQDNITNQIVNELHYHNNKIFFLRKVTMDSWKAQGIQYLMENTEVIVKNNKIIFWRSQYTHRSKSKLRERMHK